MKFKRTVAIASSLILICTVFVFYTSFPSFDADPIDPYSIKSIHRDLRKVDFYKSYQATKNLTSSEFLKLFTDIG